MIYPKIDDLTKDFNRYELVVGVSKAARIVTDEYVEMRSRAQRMIDNRETDKSLMALIKQEYKEQKPVRIAISRIHDGRYVMVRTEEGTAASEEYTEEN